MREGRLRGRPGLVWWAGSVGLLAALLLGGSAGPAAHVHVGGPALFFWVITVGAAGCWLGGLAAAGAGWRRRLPEVSILGAVLLVESSFGLVHGLAAPGYLVAPNGAMGTAALLAGPLALLAAWPLAAPTTAPARWASRHDRAYTVVCALIAAGAAAALFAGRSHVPTPSPATPAAVAISLGGLAAALALSWRQLRLYEIGGRAACLLASLALVLIGVSGLIWIDGSAFTPAWWFAHALDLIGVFGAAGALIVGYRPTAPGIAQALAPILARQPLAALELGFTPLLHQFVADLDAKDPITRDHVIRVGELAVRTGLHLGLPARQIRRLGVAAVLHDVGKLAIPDAILNKPGRLTDTEMAIMRTHTEHGHALLAAAPALADAAELVRAHHERPDGTGYPDRLRSDQIPLEAAIISVCDAYDAIAHTRQYRRGLGQELATAVLREHAGTQWLPAAVDAVIAVIPELDDIPAFAAVGTHQKVPRPATAEVCPDAIPSAAAP